jgi:hypothetical protein
LQISAIVLVRMVKIIVGYRYIGSHCLRERPVKLTTIDPIGEERVLVEVVEKLQNRLIGNQEAKQMRVAMTGYDPKQRRAIYVGTLANKRVQRDFACRRVRYGPCSRPPDVDFTRDRSQPPQQLAADGSR